MKDKRSRRFQDLFLEDRYLLLKNHLYNYRLRCRAIRKRLKRYGGGNLLEVGSGISPIVTDCPTAVFSDISWTALQQLRRHLGHGQFVVADAASLPFRSGAFSLGISSEVLEHIARDGDAVSEFSRVLRPGGRLLVTFPHRQAYFSNDDRYVSHFRRYEIAGMERMLAGSGLEIEAMETVLGVLDKLLMSIAVRVYSSANPQPSVASSSGHGAGPVVAIFFRWINTVIMGIAWLEARWIPRSMATVLMVACRRRRGNSRCGDQPSPSLPGTPHAR